MGDLFQKNCCEKYLEKGWNVPKRIPWRHGSFDSKNKFANIVYGKCLA